MSEASQRRDWEPCLSSQRPVSGFANYRTPISGLYICGASMHPGGGVSGIPGYNAGREVLKDIKRKVA